MTELQERPRYFEGQYLSAADLTAAVEYSRSQHARTLLGAHRWGIAIGMDLVEVAGPNATTDVVLTPGYAWDGFGRPIVVAEPAKLSPNLFGSYDAMFVPGNAPPAPVPVEVWVRYDEALGQPPRPGFETCDATSAYARVTERFTLEVGPRNEPRLRRDPVSIGGRTMDAAEALKTFDAAAPLVVDASIPHQSLPEEGDRRSWLVPLGLVMYQPGNPGKLVARTVDAKRAHRAGRQHIGVVAGSVEAADGSVRVHDRGKDYSSAAPDELLCVEGDIRSDGDVRIFGHRLEFVASHGESPRAPFQVLREDDLATGAAALTVLIGDKQAGDNKFVVARRSGQAGGQDQLQARMVVTDKGNVGIGTEEPKTLLHMGEQGLQIGTSAAPEENFHIRSDAGGGPRALRFYNRDVGAGVPLVSFTAAGRVGIGETSPSNVVHVRGSLGLRQESMYLSGDGRWSSLTFNAHHNAANTGWVFPDPSKPAVTIEMDAISGSPRFEVFSTVLGNNQAWSSRFFVNGHTGDVGIGTATPAARLDVNGDLRFAGLAAVGCSTRVRIVWGAVGEDGAITAGEGFSAAKAGGGGRYALTFTPPFTGQPTLVVSRVHQLLTANAGTSVTAAETAVVDQVLPGNAIVATANTSGTRVDGGFTFVAIGPR